MQSWPTRSTARHPEEEAPHVSKNIGNLCVKTLQHTTANKMTTVNKIKPKQALFFGFFLFFFPWGQLLIINIRTFPSVSSPQSQFGKHQTKITSFLGKKFGCHMKHTWTVWDKYENAQFFTEYFPQYALQFLDLAEFRLLTRDIRNSRVYGTRSWKCSAHSREQLFSFYLQEPSLKLLLLPARFISSSKT